MADGPEWLREVLAPVRRRIGEVIAYSSIINLLAIAAPIFVLQVYDRVVFHGGLSTLQGLVIGMFAAIVFDFVLRQGRARLLRSAAVDMDVELARALYSRITAAPLPVLESRPTAYWQALFRDAEVVRNAFSGLSAVLIADLPFALFFAVVIFIIAPPVAWVLLAAFPLFIGLAWWSGRVMQDANREEREASFDRDAVTAELIGGRTTIKALALKGPMTEVWEARHVRAVDESVRRGRQSDRFVHMGLGLTVLTTVAVTAVGAVAILNQELSIGALVAANMLGGRIVQPFQQLIGNWRTYMATRQSLKRLGEAFATAEEPARGAVRPNVRDGVLMLDDVTFGYAPDRPPAVRNVRLKIGNGLHALVGPNGSGKTTLLKLMQGLYRPSHGRVMLDEADIAQFGREDLARAIGYVPQHTFLFAGTIRENIAIGDPGADDGLIVDAAHLAGAHSAISEMADGYGARIGEGGMDLPGGVRQRIAIARALLGNPPVLLLDEPSGNLDTEAAKTLARNLEALAEDRTIVVVTHSPVLLEVCHNIIALDGGRIVAAGPAGQVRERMEAARRLKEVER
ncbi:peptidase domain-containing ABC transporter [Minwuia thermotolerans]|uniref:Type I secretion system ATPase n=1 Tax=Minwuia thermotolerans TaxID=2056226 RepID=A0A2M9G7E3_9PROT|nr:ATP-binding cassette domain-containing protein [Minwuia thermotolerans]PJK31596.1 type I secretion system ATPase [Minwuia thermotolerans]